MSPHVIKACGGRLERRPEASRRLRDAASRPAKPRFRLDGVRDDADGQCARRRRRARFESQRAPLALPRRVDARARRGYVSARRTGPTSLSCAEGASYGVGTHRTSSCSGSTPSRSQTRGRSQPVDASSPHTRNEARDARVTRRSRRTCRLQRWRRASPRTPRRCRRGLVRYLVFRYRYRC